MANEPKKTNPTGNTDPNKAQEEIGRAQKAWQEYKAQGRDDLANDARSYAQTQRDLYVKSGGNAEDVAEGKDLTSLYKASQPAGVYDPSMPGKQERTQDSVAQQRPTMQQGMTFQDALNQARARFDPLKQESARELATNHQQNRGNIDQMSAARGLGHSGLVVDAANKTNAGYESALAKSNATYDSQMAQMATDIQRDDRNFNFQQWMAQNGIYDNDRNFGYQQSRDRVNDQRYQDQFDWQKAVTESGMTGRWNGQDTLQKQAQDFQKAMTEAGMTGMMNGQWTLPARLQFASMYGRDPVTGQATTNVEQFAQQLGLSYAQMQQAQNQFNSNLGFQDYWNRTNLGYDQSMQNRNFGLQKVNIISQLNDLPAEKAGQYLQGFVNLGVFSQDEANQYLNYWRGGGKVPTSAVGIGATPENGFNWSNIFQQGK